MGRPLMFKTPKELKDKIDEYFLLCKTTGTRPFLSEMAVFLGTTRETLREYKGRKSYVDALEEAKSKCEVELERNLIEGKVNPTGSIFNLKNNYGWKDQQSIDHTTAGKEIQVQKINYIIPIQTSVLPPDNNPVQIAETI